MIPCRGVCCRAVVTCVALVWRGLGVGAMSFKCPGCLKNMRDWITNVVLGRVGDAEFVWELYPLVDSLCVCDRFWAPCVLVCGLVCPVYVIVCQWIYVETTKGHDSAGSCAEFRVCLFWQRLCVVMLQAVVEQGTRSLVC